MQHDLNPRRARRNVERKTTMWLVELMALLTAAQWLNLLSAALCVALACGMNDRAGAILSALLCVLAAFL